MIAITRIEDTDRLAAGLELFESVLPGSMRRNGRDHRHFARLLRSGSGVVVIAEDRDSPVGIFLGTPREDRMLYYDAVVAPGVDAPPVIADLVEVGARHAAAAGYVRLMSHEPVDRPQLYESLGHVPTIRIQFNGPNRVERRRETVQELKDHRVLALDSADDWHDAWFRIDRVDTALQEQLSAPNRYVMHMMHRWAGDDRPRHIATSYPRFHKHAARELRQIDPDLEAAGMLDAGTTQLRSGRPGHDIRSALAAEPAVFVHHAAPVTEEIALAGDRTDIAVITAAVRHMRLPTDFSYAVECRKGRSTIAGPHTVAAYTTRDIEIAVGTALAADSHSIELRHPDRVISIYLSDSSALMGVHAGEFADRMRRTPPTLVSRAEHKLAEALDIFRINVAAGQNALDLGAAPGGWSYLLAERGMTVTAVDPGAFATAVEIHPGITHIRGRAEDLRLPPASFTLAVNDMNMDPADSAHVMCSIADLLLPEGRAVLTIKLPGRADRGIAAATAVLESAYDIVDIRHLPHNRQEVTALLRPRSD